MYCSKCHIHYEGNLCPNRCDIPDKKQSTNRILLIIIGSGLTLLIVFSIILQIIVHNDVNASIMQSKSKVVTSKTKARKTSKPMPIPTSIISVDATLTAEELINAYENNELKADKDYNGKKIKLTGIVNDIGTDLFNNVYLKISDTYSKNNYIYIQTFLGRGEKDKATQLEKGDEVTIIGKVNGVLINIQMKDCIIVDE